MKEKQNFWSIPKAIIENKKLIFGLAKNDFKTKYAGSYLGTIWAFIQPIITVLVYWFVFGAALKPEAITSGNNIEVPFVCWLVCGLIPWFFFSDGWNGITSSLLEYSYLVKKVVFKIEVLPVVKLVSSLFVHLFFIGFGIILYLAYGFTPDWYWLQMLYYSIALCFFVLGLGYMTSALVLFFRDLSQIINILMQVGVWVTPIMWQFETRSAGWPLWFRTILQINPMFYIVQGYRDAMVNKIWFWDRGWITIYFWVLAILMFAVGTSMFRRLRIHFADVL